MSKERATGWASMCSPGVVLIFVNIALYAFCFQMQTPVQPKLLRELGVDESEGWPHGHLGERMPMGMVAAVAAAGIAQLASCDRERDFASQLRGGGTWRANRGARHPTGCMERVYLM